MEHVFIERENALGTFILLHGTGGSERDLIPIAEEISKDMNLLGIRGNISENGMPRFFKRLSEGVFDMEDLRLRTLELTDFIRDAAEKYHFSLDTSFFLGYSNGANIGANVLLQVDTDIAGGILLHPMVPSREENTLDLQQKHVLLTAGERDPIVPLHEAEELHELLTNKGANSELYIEDNNHGITSSEIQKAREWFATLIN